MKNKEIMIKALAKAMLNVNEGYPALDNLNLPKPFTSNDNLTNEQLAERHIALLNFRNTATGIFTGYLLEVLQTENLDR